MEAIASITTKTINECRGVVISKKAEINLSSREKKRLEELSTLSQRFICQNLQGQGNSISWTQSWKRKKLNPILNKTN